jgi:lipoyl(octanoyl) transferase
MSATPQLLRHHHIPLNHPFTYAQKLQSHLLSLHSAHKASPTTTPPIPPTLLTFSPSTPTYAFGRRSPSTNLTLTERSLLLKPLLPSPPDPKIPPQKATLVDTPRGGLTTFHGPGQLVIYPVLDLKGVRSERYPRGLGVRDYVCLLEQTTINVLAKWGVEGKRTENPGVWVEISSPDQTVDEEGEHNVKVEDKKIAALGVHLRRNVASYGVGLNVYTDLRWFDRIVACGLEGLGTTSMREGWEWFREGLRQGRSRKEQYLKILGRQWGEEFARGLWGEGGEQRRERIKVGDLGVDEKVLNGILMENEREMRLIEEEWEHEKKHHW